MNNDTEIRVGSRVELLNERDGKVHDFTITDIFFENYIGGYKTIVKAMYYSEISECWYHETFFVNDFFERKLMAQKEAEND